MKDADFNKRALGPLKLSATHISATDFRFTLRMVPAEGSCCWGGVVVDEKSRFYSVGWGCD
jgi:hypothetical protein